MVEIQCTPKLTEALSRLLKVACALHHTQIVGVSLTSKQKHVRVITHIYMYLACASEASRLPSAFLDELVALCKVDAVQP